MKRREFLITGAVVAQGMCWGIEPQSSVLAVHLSDKVVDTIEAVLAHMFPEANVIPSAEAMKLVSFVRETLVHPSYDKDIRNFVIQGAQTLHAQTKGEFVLLGSAEKEKILRNYEKSDVGRQWLQRIMILGMEGMFGDPVYGSNIGKAGWKALETSGGEPRPHTRYIQL